MALLETYEHREFFQLREMAQLNHQKKLMRPAWIGQGARMYFLLPHFAQQLLGEKIGNHFDLHVIDTVERNKHEGCLCWRGMLSIPLV